MKWPLTAFCLLWLAGCGRSHAQLEGHYAFTTDRIIRDECGLASSAEFLSEGQLVVTGNIVRMTVQLAGVQVDGRSYPLEVVGYYLDRQERFSADGSGANISTRVGAQECLLDLLTVHLDAAARDSQTFSGTYSVAFDAKRPEACVCSVWVEFTARYGP